MKKTWKHRLKEKIRKVNRISAHLNHLGTTLTNVEKITPLSVMGLGSAGLSVLSSVLPEEIVDTNGWEQVNVSFENKEIFNAALRDVFDIKKTELVGSFKVRLWEHEDLLVKEISDDSGRESDSSFWVREAAKNDSEKLDRIISAAIWRHYGTRLEVKVGKTSEGYEKLKVMPPMVADQVFITSDEFNHLKDLITDYKEDGTPISIILHGPPGVGKTSIVKMLLQETSWLAVRVSAEAAQHYLWDVLWVIDLLKPDLVIMDDLDRTIRNNHSYTFLEFLETIRKVVPVVVATMNVIGQLDPVYIRPDRFDHQIPVTHLPDEVFEKLTANLPVEWKSKIRSWPAAYIHEFNRRVRIRKGKDPLEDYYEELQKRLANQERVYNV